VTFTASVTGVGPFSYRWQHDGQELPGTASSSLVVSNVQLKDEGIYLAIASNAFGAVTSSPVTLIVLVNPAVVLPALSQRVVAGANATFSFAVSGNPPPFGYQLRRSTSILTNYTSNERVGFLTLAGVQSSNAGTYRIVVTNAANPSPGLTLDPISLTVLADFDGDGLPDEWEAAHGLATNNAADANYDLDLDGQLNSQEYLAGTNPNDPGSWLRIEHLSIAPDQTAAVIEFNAASNQTYTLQFRDAFGDGSWKKLIDLAAQPTSRFMTLTNPLDGAGYRYYRLATPRLP
jgi:hypothetical protein